MNVQLLLAVGIISVGLFGLVGLWIYSQIKRPVKRQKATRRNSDLIVVHRFKSSKKRRAMRPAPAAPAAVMDAAPDDDSRWRRPGSAPLPQAANERAPLPYYEPDKPRHVLVPRTPAPLVAGEVIEAPKPQPRLSQRTQRSQPTALIKTIRVEPETQKPAVKAGRFDVAI